MIGGTSPSPTGDRPPLEAPPGDPEREGARAALLALAAEGVPLSRLPERIGGVLAELLPCDRLELYATLPVGGLARAAWPAQGASGAVQIVGRPSAIASAALLDGVVCVPDAGESDGRGSGVATVLRFAGETVGVLVVGCERPGALGPEHAAVAGHLASAIAACVAGSRPGGGEDTVELAGELEAMRSAMSASLDVEAAFGVVARAAARLLRFDQAAIDLVGSRRGLVERFAQAEIADAGAMTVRAPAGDPIALSQSAVGIVHATDAPLMVGDLARDPRFCGADDRSLARAGLRSYLAVPLRLEGRSIGVLRFAARVPDAFADDELSRVQLIAEHIATSVHNLRVQALARLQGAVEERGRLSRAYADGPHTRLGRALTMLERDDSAFSAVTLHECRTQVLEARSLTRQLLAGGSDLMAARLDEQIDAVGRAWGLDVNFSVSGAPTALSIEAEAALEHAARIVVSALARYRRSWRADVELEFRGEDVRLTIVDEGHTTPADSGLAATLAVAEACIEREGGSLAAMRSSILRQKIEMALPVLGSAALTAVAASESAIVRSGLVEVMRAARGVELVAVASDHAQFVEYCRALRPTVAIAALGPVTPDSVALLPWLRDASPETEVLVLAPSVETWDVEACLHAGARGCLSDQIGPVALAEAVRGAAAGAVQVPRPVSDVILRRYSHLMADRSGTEALSQREVEVLALLAQGCKNREIAEQLTITQHTVKTHISRIFAKLGTTDRASTVRVALLRRLIPDELVALDDGQD